MLWFIIDKFIISVGKVTYVDIVKNGCALVEFMTGDMALASIQIMNKYELNGRKLVVKKVRILIVLLNFIF